MMPAPFCEWLLRQTGVLYRLPTEADWEYIGRDYDMNNDSIAKEVGL